MVQPAGSSPSDERSRYVLSRWLFLRALGVVFFIAFLSLASQASGLFGSQGIAPARELLDGARGMGVRAYQLPTLFWAFSSDAALKVGLAAGLLLSVLLALGVAPRLVLLLLWALYLSFVSIGDVFLGYQWDVLLIETAFTAAWLAPGALARRRVEPPPSGWALFLSRWLLFRLMWMSGVVKLASGDVHWRDLSALDYHFWTQPLPTLAGWYAAHLPTWALHACCAAALLVELVLPLLVFMNRPARLAAAVGFLGLQLAIALTGNYGFFNLLTCVLCVPLLDDGALRRLWPGAPWLPTAEAPPARRRAWTAGAATAAVVLLTSAVSLARLVPLRTPGPRAVLGAVRPFATFNAYGLFAVMTTGRDELSFEGSDDGVSWKPYRFRWKPDRPDRAPGQVAPLQPRLDWQMWFAALSTCEESPWLIRFSERLLRGAPQVLGLLAENPFGARPPRLIRSTRWHFRPTSLTEERSTGRYWSVSGGEPYCPVLTLEHGRLASQ